MSEELIRIRDMAVSSCTYTGMYSNKPTSINPNATIEVKNAGKSPLWLKVFSLTLE